MFQAAFDRAFAFYTGRSPQWAGIRRIWLSSHPTCAACGSRKSVEVHHIRPVHAFPGEELDPANLISLCRTHHFWHGHLGAWQSWNAFVVSDAADFLARVRARP